MPSSLNCENKNELPINLRSRTTIWWVLLRVASHFCSQLSLNYFVGCNCFLNIVVNQLAKLIQCQHWKWLFNKNTNLQKSIIIISEYENCILFAKYATACVATWWHKVNTCDSFNIFNSFERERERERESMLLNTIQLQVNKFSTPYKKKKKKKKEDLHDWRPIANDKKKYMCLDVDSHFYFSICLINSHIWEPLASIISNFITRKTEFNLKKKGEGGGKPMDKT